jgi:hypothetical protein
MTTQEESKTCLSWNVFQSIKSLKNSNVAQKMEMTQPNISWFESVD